LTISSEIVYNVYHHMKNSVKNVREKFVSARITKTVFQRLRKTAEKTKRTVSAIVSELLEKHA
jgi:predicted DNA-binding protein